MPTILQVMADPNLLGRHFRNKSTWQAWRVFLAALFGLPVGDSLDLYQRCTGKSESPRGQATEAALIVGRRGGKSRVLALIAVYLALFRDWKPYLVPGENLYIVVIAADRRQCRVIMGYIRAFLTETPILAGHVVRDNAEELELDNRIVIEVATCSYRTIRGRAVAAGLCDELAFWHSDEGSTNPDTEVLAALRPAMATVPGAMLLLASSPYARRGALWASYRKHYGKDDSKVLVWKADTRTMNPTVPQSIVDEAIEADPASAAAEFGADFRTDVETFIAREVIDGVTIHGRYELPPMSGMRYTGFIDPSGGSADSMTCAIGHRDKDGNAILDAVREVRPPFSPDAVTAEFAALLKSYGVHSVQSDRYGGDWVTERFRKHGITCELAEKTKSEFYQAALPLLNSGRVELLDLPRLVSQICSLERRTARGGKDSIDHPPGASFHDDVANSALACLALCAGKAPRLVVPDGAMAMARRGPSPFRRFGSRPGVSFPNEGQIINRVPIAHAGETVDVLAAAERFRR
jgi:hypothetical protein